MSFFKDNLKRGFEQIKNFFESILLYFDELKKKSNEILILLLLWSILFYFPRKWIQYGVLPAIIEIIFYYFSLSIFIDVFKSFFVFLYKKRHNYASDYFDNFILGTERLSLLILNIMFFFFFLYLININIKDFLTSISIFAVAIVLIFKDYISNVINGMIIMFSPDYNVKDYIKINEHKGRIINISFLNTEIRTEEGDIIYIPNDHFFREKVINYSKSNIKKIRYEFKMNLDFANKMDEFKNYISSGLCKEFEGLIVEENIAIKVNGLNQDNIELMLEVTSQKYNFKFEDKIKTVFSNLLVKFIAFDSKTIGEIEKKPAVMEILSPELKPETSEIKKE